MIKLLLPLFLLFSPMAWGFAQYDSSGSGTSASASSLTFTHVMNGGNELYVDNTNLGTTEASGVTYGGVAMANFGDFQTANGYSTDVWHLANPPQGSNSVIITFPVLTADIVAISKSYSGVGNGYPSNASWNGDTGEDNYDGVCTGSSTTASTSCEPFTSLEYKNDLISMTVFTLITGTKPSTPTNGVNRLDVTGTTVRGDLFDVYPATSSGASSTVGNGVWSCPYVVETSNAGYNRFLK